MYFIIKALKISDSYSNIFFQTPVSRFLIVRWISTHFPKATIFFLNLHYYLFYMFFSLLSINSYFAWIIIILYIYGCMKVFQLFASPPLALKLLEFTLLIIYWTSHPYRPH